MGNAQSSSSSRGEQVTGATSAVPSSADLPCSREMVEYLQCVRTHPDGLTGAVDQCDTFRQNYKLCMAEYKKAKRGKANLQHRVLLGSFSRDPGTFAFGAHLQASWELFDPVSLSAARRAGRGFGPLDSAAGTQAETRAGTPRGRGEDGDFTARERGAATGATAESCAPYYRIFVTCYPQANICVYAVAQPGLLKAQQGGRAEEAAREGQRAAGRSAGGQERRNAVGRGSLGGAEEPPGDVSTPPDGERQSGGAQGGRSPAAPSSWTQRGGKAEARSQKKGGRSGASKRDGLSVSFEERGSEGTGGTQEARDCGGRRSSLRRRARERSSLLALQADSAARLFPPFLFNASSATFTSGESAGEDSEEDAVESPSYFGFPPAGRGGEEATARVSGPPPLGTKRIGGAGGTFTPATVAAALSTPSLLLQHRPASLRPLEIRFSAVLSLPVRGAAVACSPRHLIVGCARQPALLFLSLDGLRTVQAVIYLSDFLPRAEASSQVSARAEDRQQLGDAEEAAGRDRGADARAEAVGESQVGSTVETGKRGRQLGDEPTLQAECLHGESHEDGSDHGRSGENVKRAAEAAARRRQWERTARAAGDSNGSQGAADGCVSVPAGEQFASSCRPQERARGSRSSSLGSAPRSDSPNFCACGEFLFSPLGHATIEEVVRFEDRTEDVVLLPDLPDEALRDARAAADAHRHLEDLLRLASEEAKREVDRQPQSATHHGGGTELGTDEEDGAERGAPPSSSLVRTVRSLLHARHGGEAPEGLASCCSSSWDGAEDSGEHRVVTGDSEAEGAAGAESAAGPRIRGGLSNIAAALSEGVAQIALDARLSLLGVVTTHGRFFLLSWRAPLFLRPAQVGAANRSSNSASSPLASSSHSQGPGAGLDAERSTPHEGEGVGRHSPPIGILLRHHRVACCALNAERRLLALGLTNGEIELYSLDFSVSSSSAGSHASPAASACGRVERAQSPPGEGTAADAAALQGRDRAALPRGRCPCEVVRLVRRLNLRDACEGPEAAPQGRARGSRERFGRIEKEERAARSRTPSGASLLASGSSSSLRSGRQLFAAEGASRLFWGEDGRAEEGGHHRVETLVWSDDGLALAAKSRGRPRVASDAGEENDGEPPSGPGAPVAVFSYTGRLLLAPFSPPPPLPPRARSRSASSAASPLLSASAAPCAPSQASLMNGAAALAADVHGARMPLPSQGAGDLTPPPETRSVPLIPPVAHAPTCAWTGLGLGLIVSQEAEQRQANAVGEEEAWGGAVGGRRGSEDGFRRGSACARLLPPDVFEFPIFRSAWLGVGTTAVDSAGSRAASDAGDRILIGSSCLLLWAALPHLPASLSWSRIPLPPPMYLSPNWPIRQASLSPNEEFLLVSGTRGFAVFSLGQRRWRVLGDEQQERQLPTGLLPQGWYDPSIFFISIRTFDPDVSPVEAALAALAPLPVNSLSLSSPEHSKRLLSSLSSLPLPTPHLGRKPHAALAPAAAFSGGFSGVAVASQHPTAAEASPREHARASRSSSFLFGSPQPPLSALSSPRLPSGVSLPGWRGPRGSALAAEVSLERRAAQTPFCVSQQLPGMSLQERETWEAVLERLEVDSTSSAQLFTSPHVPSPQAAQGSPVSRASAASPLSGGEASAGRDNRGERGGGASTAAGFWSSKRQRAQKVTPKTGYALLFFDVRGRLAVENCVATVRALPARPLRTALLSTRQKPSANPPKRRGVRGAPARRLDAGTGRRAHVEGRGEGLQVSGGEQRRQCCRCGRRQAEARRRREAEGRQEDSSREDGEADAGRFEFDGHDGASTARYGGEGESSSDSEEGCALCKGLSEKEITGYLAAPPALNLATDAPILAVYDALHLITAYQLRPAAPRLPSSALSLSPDPPSYSSLHRTVSQPAGSAQPPAARCAPPRRAAERFPSLAAAGSTLHSRPSAATLASSPSSSAASASLPSSLLVGASLSTSLPICTYDVLALWQVDLSSCWVDHPLQIRFAASPALLVVLHAGGEVTALRLVSKEECGAALLREKAKGGEAEALQTKTVAAAIESRRHEKGVKFGEARPDQRQGISSRGEAPEAWVSEDSASPSTSFSPFSRLASFSLASSPSSSLPSSRASTASAFSSRSASLSFPSQRSLHLVPQLVAQQSRAFGSGVTSLWLDPPAQLPFFCPLPARPIFALRDVSGLRRGLLSAQQGAASADGGAAACAEEDRPDVARDADAEAEWRGCVCAVCTVGGAAGESLGALGGDRGRRRWRRLRPPSSRSFSLETLESFEEDRLRAWSPPEPASAVRDGVCEVRSDCAHPTKVRLPLGAEGNGQEEERESGERQANAWGAQTAGAGSSASLGEPQASSQRDARAESAKDDSCPSAAISQRDCPPAPRAEPPLASPPPPSLSSLSSPTSHLRAARGRRPVGSPSAPPLAELCSAHRAASSPAFLQPLTCFTCACTPQRLPPFSESRARPRVPPQTPASCVSSSLSAGGARASEGRDATEKGRRQREAERPAAAQRGESERGMAVEASSCSPRTATRPPAQPRPNASSGSGATAGSQERRTGVDGRERNELHVQEVERQRSGERHSASRRSHRWRGNEDLVLAGEDEAANPRHFRGSTSFGDHFCCPFTPLPSHPPLFALGRTRCGLSHSLPLSSSPLCSSSSISLSSLYPLDSHGGSSCGLPSPRSVTRVACSVSQGGEAACGAARTQGEREEMATTVREASGEPKQKDGSADEGVAKGDKNGEGGMAGHRGVEAVDSTRISAEESSQEETDAQLCSCSPCLEVETRSKRRGGSGSSSLPVCAGALACCAVGGVYVWLQEARGLSLAVLSFHIHFAPEDGGDESASSSWSLSLTPSPRGASVRDGADPGEAVVRQENQAARRDARESVETRSRSPGGQTTWRGYSRGHSPAATRSSAARGFLDVECCYALLLPIEQKPEPLLIAGVLAPLGVVVACSPSRVAVRRASLPPPTAAECAERRGRQRLRAPCINLRLQLQPSLHPLLTRLLAVSAADRSFVHAHPPLSGVAFPARRAAGPGPSVGRLSPRPASGPQSPFPSPSPVGALACGVGLRAHETAAELLFQIRASPFFTHLVELALYELFERFLSGFKRELRALAPFKASRSAQTPPANGLAQAGVAGASPQRDANGECRSGVSGVSASSTLPHQKRGSMESENVGDPTEGWAAAAGAELMRHREEGLQRREIGLQSSRFSPSACSGPCSAEQKGANRNDSGKETRQQRLPRAPSPPAKAYVLSLPQAQVSTENEEARRRRHQGGAAPQETSRVLQRTNRGDWEDAERAREAGKEMASQRKLAASDGRELAQPGSEEAMGPRRSRDARKKDRDRDEFGKASARYEDSHGGAKQAYGIAEAERRACALFSLDRLLRAEDVSEAFSLVAPRAHPYRVPVPSQLSSGPSLSPSSGLDVPLPSSASSRSVARAGSHGALSPHPAASSPSAELSLQQRFAVAQEALTALPGGAALYLFLHLLSRHSPSTLAKTVASCVRKTEPTLAPLVLFPLLGSPPATYFEDAMKRQLLHTASIYLLVLQNTEGCLVVRQKRALPLLRAALRLGVAGLARKLVRFVLALLVAYPARKRAENSACEATGDPTESAKARQASVHALREGNCEEDIVVPWSGAGGAPALWAPPALFQERRRSRSHAARSRAEEKPAREGEQLHSQVEEEEGSRRAQKAKHGQRAEERAERQADAKADEERAIFQLYRDVVAIVEDCLLSSLVHLQWLRVFQLTSVLALDLPAWLFRLRPHICRVFSLDGPCGLLPSPESAPVVSPCCSHSQCLFLQDDPAVPFERVVLSLVSQLGLSARGFASRSIWSAAQWRACLLGSRSLPSLCRTTEMGRLHQGSLLARTSSRASSHFGVDASLAISDSAEAAPAPTACREGTDLQSEEADARVLAASHSACERKRGSYAAVSGAWVHLPSVRGLTPSPAPASPFPSPTFREFRACTQRPHAGLHAQVSPPSSSVPLPLPDGWFTHKQVYRGRLASSFSPRTNARAGAPSPPAGLPQRLGRRVQPNFVSGSEGEYSLRAATESLTAFFLHVFVRADLPVLALALLVAAGDREGVRRILSLSPSLRLRIQMKQEESNGRVSASADTTAQQPSKAAALESGHPGGRSREDAKTAGGGAVRRKQNRDAGGWAAMSRSLRELLFVMAEQAAESGAPTGERIEPPAGRNGERIRKT